MFTLWPITRCCLPFPFLSPAISRGKQSNQCGADTCSQKKISLLSSTLQISLVGNITRIDFLNGRDGYFNSAKVLVCIAIMLRYLLLRSRTSILCKFFALFLGRLCHWPPWRVCFWFISTGFVSGFSFVVTP
jgi:hypothetical protein